MLRLVKLLIVLAVLGTVAYFWAPPRLIALKLIGRGHGCPFGRTIGSSEYLRGLGKSAAAIARESRLIAQEPGYHLWETPRGRFWVPAAGGDAGLWWDLAEQDAQIYGDGVHAVRAGDFVLDCGSNIGVYTGVALAAGARLVVAIEPAPENLECLRRNFSEEILNGRVVVCPKGVWDREEMLAINQDPTNSAADSFVIATPDTRKGPTLPLTTIDKLVAALKIERVDFIKMDIEGAEGKALAGGRATITRFHPRMAIAAYHRPDDDDVLPRAAHSAWPGYRMECGPCQDGGDFVQPVALLFY